MRSQPPNRLQVARAYLWAALAPIVGTLLVMPLRGRIDLSNIALIYVLLVVVSATRFGGSPAVVTALLGSLLFAFVFVPPYFSLAITETQHLLASLIMLVVALMVGHITAKLKQHADFAERKSSQSRRLYAFSQALSAAADDGAVVTATRQFLVATLGVRQVDIRVAPPDAAFTAPPTLNSPLPDGWRQLRIPLNATAGVIGMLEFEAPPEAIAPPDALEFVETLASVISVALERSRLANLAREAEVRHADESLRSSILGALSHDLRTPLAALVSMADTAALNRASPERQTYLLHAIRDKAMALSMQMTNLLEMARLSAGKVELNREWQAIDEVLGATVRLVRAQWKEREISVDLPPDLPPVLLDAVLMERVLWNLIENAIKYSPPDAPIELSARHGGDDLVLNVDDAGPGLPAGDPSALFNLFQRGKQESDVAGMGLGLSISRTIVEAHGGRITASNRPGGGARFSVTLPLGVPPAFSQFDEAP